MKSGRRNKISPDTPLKVKVRFVSFTIRNLKKENILLDLEHWGTRLLVEKVTLCCFLILWEQSEKVGMSRRERIECSG